MIFLAGVLRPNLIRHARFGMILMGLAALTSCGGGSSSNSGGGGGGGPTVSFDEANYTAINGFLEPEIMLRLGTASDSLLSVTITITESASGASYSLTGNSNPVLGTFNVLFFPGETAKLVAKVNPAATTTPVNLTFSLTPPSGYRAGSNATAIVQVREQNEVAFEANDRNNHRDLFDVIRGDALGANIVIRLRDPVAFGGGSKTLPLVVSSTATAGTDYTITGGVHDTTAGRLEVTFAEGEVSKIITITALAAASHQDSIVIGVDARILPTGYKAFVRGNKVVSEVTARIVVKTGSDILLYFTSPDLLQLREGESGDAIVRLSEPAPAEVTFAFRFNEAFGRLNVEPEDYQAMPTMVTFAAGEQKKTITITALVDADTDNEEDLQIALPLSLPTGYTSSVSGLFQTIGGGQEPVYFPSSALVKIFQSDRIVIFSVRDPDTLIIRP